MSEITLEVQQNLNNYNQDFDLTISSLRTKYEVKKDCFEEQPDKKFISVHTKKDQQNDLTVTGAIFDERGRLMCYPGDKSTEFTLNTWIITIKLR